MLIKTHILTNSINQLKTNTEYLIFQKKDDFLFITKWEDKHQVQHKLELLESNGADNTITIDAGKLIKICNIFKRNTGVELFIEKDQLIIKSNNSKITLKKANILLNTETADAKQSIKSTLVIEDLSTVLKNIKYAIAKNDTRYCLNAFLIGITENGCYLVATNGSRMIKQSLKISSDYPKELSEHLIFRKSVDDILKLTGSTVMNVFDNNDVQLINGSCTIFIKNADANYVPYNSVIPKGKADIFITVNDANEFKTSLSNLKHITKKKSLACMLSYAHKDDKLKLTVNNSDYISFDYDCTTEFDYGFNIKYLEEQIANTIIKDNKILIELFINKNSNKEYENATLVTRSVTQVLILMGMFF